MTDERPDDYSDDDYQSARSAAAVPATLLIAVGLLSAVFAIIGLIQLNSAPEQIDQMIEQVEADPNKTREEKDQAIDVFNTSKDLIPAAPIFYIMNLVCSGLVVLGGIKLLKLSGPALPAIGSVLAMLPCTGCCCPLGLLVGIWALVVLYRPDVRAAMAAKKNGPEEEYRAQADGQ